MTPASSPRCRASATISSCSTACASSSRSTRRRSSRARRPPLRRRLRPGAGGRARAGRTPTSATASSTPTAARSSSAATARAASSRFVRDHGLTDKREIRVETAGGRHRAAPRGRRRRDRRHGRPALSPRRTFRSPAAAGGAHRSARRGRRRRSPSRCCRWAIRTPCRCVADVDAAPVTTQGPRIEHHPRFPQRVNAGYMQVVDRDTIRLRVWERGAGETLACGTGACAAVSPASAAACSTPRARDHARRRAHDRVARRGHAGDDDGRRRSRCSRANGRAGRTRP